MKIRTLPLVPRDLFEKVDEDWHQYGMFSGIATQWWVLGPIDDSAYYVVPDYNGPRALTRVTYHIIVVEPEPHANRSIRQAMSLAAQQAALGIAAACAQEQVIPEVTC